MLNLGVSISFQTFNRVLIPMNKEFSDAVFDIVRLIPKGRVTSYGAIAKCIGMSKSSRMVGMVLKNCSYEKDPVPAHRVVNRNGYLTGKAAFGDGETMANLLRVEGINVEDDKVVNFQIVFWNPFEEISLE